MTGLRAMLSANPADPANPLFSGTIGSMPERTFAHLKRFSGLDLQGVAPSLPNGCRRHSFSSVAGQATSSLPSFTLTSSVPLPSG